MTITNIHTFFADSIMIVIINYIALRNILLCIRTTYKCHCKFKTKEVKGIAKVRQTILLS